MIKAIGLYSQNLYQNQRVLRRSIYIEPVLTSREECNVFADLFLEFIHVFRFCQPACFFAARFTLRQPKTPVRNTTNLRTFCFEDYHCVFVLWHSLIRSLYFIKFIFYYLWYIPPHSCAFHRFTLHQFFLMYITTRNIILIPDDAVVRKLIIIFNFSSWRPHLNYIFLSNVYSFDTMEFSMKHKC